ncbi:Oidioi.mRNA.OKI2018_I69.XSR.g14871.t1.cds [Oikopleura dioica]|uniref:Oidioi.mRNA.OKI2018_I69.XSR.g14871.t1.cds n=1 Tax=Oikopleura dioica TaxID=34765 RepID=A0ABN7SG33_OIKDI|nr:Oidioi.mRNA.OKI2018_I69.XSR.g14871.t1.cds [Oikopleura dioica]
MGFEEPVPMKVQTKNMDGTEERKLKPAVRKPTDGNKEDIPEDQKLSYPRVKHTDFFWSPVRFKKRMPHNHGTLINEDFTSRFRKGDVFPNFKIEVNISSEKNCYFNTKHDFILKPAIDSLSHLRESIEEAYDSHAPSLSKAERCINENLGLYDDNSLFEEPSVPLDPPDPNQGFLEWLEARGIPYLKPEYNDEDSSVDEDSSECENAYYDFDGQRHWDQEKTFVPEDTDDSYNPYDW